MLNCLKVSITVGLVTATGAALADRATTVINAIDSWNAGLSTQNRQEKYCRLAVSPFTFYRGSNHLFWQDFANDNRLNTFGSSVTKTWIQGDLHTDNFGSYDDDNGTVIYELNDFDESVVADYQYDVWRMAVSLLLVARDNGDFSQSNQQWFVDAFSEHYLDALADFRGNSSETSISYTANNTYGRLDNFLDDVEQSESRRELLDRWAPVSGSTRKFDLSNERLGALPSSTRAAIINAMPAYGATLDGGLNYSSSYFKVKDVAQRLLAGIGSFGTPRYYILIEGASSSNNDDRILDIKQQGRPTPYQFLGSGFRQDYNAIFSNDAARHSIAYNAITRHTDDHLGWLQLGAAFFSVRERSPYQGGFDTTELTTNTRFTNLAEQWGTILATAHARTDRDADSFYVPYSFDTEVDKLTDGKHAEFRALVRSVALDYADQVADDYITFISARAGHCF